MKKIKIFDTHTHDYFESFDSDREQMLADDFASGVKHKIQIGCDMDTSKQAIELAHTSNKMFATVGLHPCYVEENFENLDKSFIYFKEELEKNYKNNTTTKKIVAIGETGFDFYHNDSPKMREHQQISFEKHIELCKKYTLPIIIHTRNARNETLEFLQKNIITKNKEISGVIHCFSENAEFAKIVTTQFNFFISIGGAATYPKSHDIRDAILHTPIQYIVTETDSPYLAPQSVRGKRNQSKNIKEIIELIANIKKMNSEECSNILFENAKRLFNMN
ncbi:TPA: TatD family hydrolase [Candidatus Gracilibacteria bacterium]|nr:TatD family deoxyribonuclease [Candidatus Peregrinibacteria bacterium]HIQ57043.1 TatD family hydrolase [Candidatus Gracilibacteria bacterium]HIQ57224.1 TatD family hydrolase [Candidatus Gracilibacteria bacterium]